MTSGKVRVVVVLSSLVFEAVVAGDWPQARATLVVLAHLFHH